MWDWALPILYAVFLWWFGTVVVLYLNGVSPATARRGFWIGCGLAAFSLIAIVATRNQAEPLALYVAFTAGVVIWGWHELGYYAGVITGPSSEPCPPEASDARRFYEGVRTCLHHELAVLATALALGLVTLGSVNSLGYQTFAILWLMRWSAKLNIFLGVRNLHEEFWPRHLAYLATYTRRRSMNPLFPISLLGAGAMLVLIVRSALEASAAGALPTAQVLAATLLVLAILEHLLLMAPISDDVLWRWGMRSRDQEAPGPGTVRAASPKSV